MNDFISMRGHILKFHNKACLESKCSQQVNLIKRR
jgi:hypothetical protein